MNDFSDLKSFAEMAVEYLNLLVDSTKGLTDAQREQTEYLNLLIDETKDNTNATKDNTRATKDNSGALRDLKSNSIAVGRELLNIANAGVKFGTAIGVTATRGVQLEIQNRLAVASQLLKFNANLAVTTEQLKGAQEGFAQAFVGAAEGMQISAQGSIGLVSDLKKGFKSEFTPTAETFRVLTQMGISTTEQFDAFRRATGRASLSNSQLTNLYNKNQLSFLLYGNSFARAAVQAERLGINLSSIQSAQESLVTNLDGTIDTVAQINQLGGQIDFGSLVRMAETEGPDALMAYVRATVPANLMQSASTRALFRQLGISVEDYIKSGGAQQSAAEQLESRMTEASKETGTTTKAFGVLGATISKGATVLTGSFGILALSALKAALALNSLGSAGIAGLGRSMGLVSPMGGLGRVAAMYRAAGPLATIGGAAAGLGGGTLLGSAFGGTTTGSGIGSLIGTGLGAFFGPGGMAIGGLMGGALGGLITRPAGDMYSSGYGNRVLVTPNGAFSLNNADDIIAGTNLFPKGSLKAGGDNSELVRKVDNLITALSNATTTINVGGAMQTVPRMSLVGVYSRNERV